MLPHQVRPILPRIRKLIEKNAPENDGIQDSFLIRGGPLVRAVYSDLQAICETHFLPHFVNNGTTKIENAFIMFKDIFNRCQMSLLHTKLIPERADRSQWTQLLYHACFQMIEEEAEKSLLKTSFGIFALYTLYETCPLPNPPPADTASDHEALTMVPNGVYDRFHPQRTYRRNFKAHIRIDRIRYIILMQMRDRSLAAIARKQPAAEETVCVLDRLFDSRLHLCEYIGPQSLDAIVIHPEYRFSTRSLEGSDGIVGPELAPLLQKTRTVLDASQPGGKCSQDVLQAFSSYQNSLAKIRLPSATSRKPADVQLREALLPLFEDGRRKYLEEYIRYDPAINNTLLLDTQLRVKRVTFGPPPIVAIGGTDDQLSENEDASMNDNSSTLEHRTDFQHDIILPKSTPIDLRQSLRAGIQTLLDRDPSTFRSQLHDAVSTLGQESSLAATSISMGMGQKALQALFARVSTSFFDSQQGMTESTSGIAPEEEDDDDFDEGSIHSGLVSGIAALDAILAAAKTAGRPQRPPRRTPYPRKPPAKRQKTEKPAPARDLTANNFSDDELSEDDDQPDTDDEKMSVASSEVGLHGLEALLARVKK